MSGAVPRHTWSLIERFLPDATDSLLLRAALLPGRAAADAWTRWLVVVGDPVRALGTDVRGLKALVPLLARNLCASGVALEPGFGTYARAAHLTETLRMTKYLREAGAALTLLSAAKVPHVVLKGAALAEGLYGDAALRHAHDFDVLVPEEALARAVAVLESRGFEAFGQAGPDLHHVAPLRNDAGLVIELHRRLSQVHAGFEAAPVRQRSVVARVGGVETRVLSRVDALVHVGEHAVSCRSSINLRWVCDAYWLARALAPGDWSELTATAIRSRVSLPLAVTLGYLESALGPIVPDAALEALRAEAAHAAPAEVSAAVFGVRRSLPMDLAGILRMRDGRLAQLAWRLLPPPRHVRWWYGITEDWRIPFYYFYRVWLLAADVASRPRRAA